MPRNVFLITSTINTPLGLINPADRFYQTINQLTSIKITDPTALLILVDNSLVPMTSEQEAEVVNLVDHFIYVGWRKFVINLNKHGIIGANEVYMVLVGLNLIKTQKISVKRLFKISGRRRFSDAFDITMYDNADFYRKYVFKKREEYVQYSGVYFLHTRFWSFCGSLVDDAIMLLSKSLETIMQDHVLIEQAIYQNINKELLVELEQLEIEGTMTFWNKLYKD